MQVEWRSFLLRPRPQEQTAEKFRAYTQSWMRPASMEPAARFRVWEGDEAPTHSIPPAIAGKVAETFGRPAFDRFHRGLLDAYFAQNRTISDPDVIVAVATETGLDGDEFARRFDRDRQLHAGAVIDDHNEAIEQGINAVPSVVVNDELVLPGALDLDAYRRVVNRLGNEQPR